MGWREFLEGSGGWLILGGLAVAAVITLLLHHFIREKGSDDPNADPRDYPGERCSICKGEGTIDSPDASLSWRCPRCEGTGWEPVYSQL